MKAKKRQWEEEERQEREGGKRESNKGRGMVIKEWLIPSELLVLMH